MTRLRTLLALVVSVVVLGSCVAEPTRQFQIGDLTNAARRVDGGGAECPLRFDREILRPPGVSAASIISPLRIDGSAARGTIGEDRPETDLGRRGGVQVDCWFRVTTLRVDVSVVAVRDGRAVAQLATRLEQHAGVSSAEIATFISASVDLAPGTAEAVPGGGAVAFARVASGDSDMGLLVAYQAIDGRGTPPAGAAVARIATSLAADLAS